jgi:hypothetical protein
MGDTLRRVFFSTLIVVSVVVGVLALWQLRLLIALLFFALIVAAAMRPGIEALRRRGIPRGAGIAAHYIAIAGLLGLLLWLAVPRAADQVEGQSELLPCATRPAGRPAGDTTRSWSSTAGFRTCRARRTSPTGPSMRRDSASRS